MSISFEQSAKLKKAFAAREGLRESKLKTGLNFLNKSAPRNLGVAFDHTTYWNKDGKPFAIISQPYSLDDFEMGIVREYCKKYGLRCMVTTKPDWHNPNHVFSMVWMKQKP